MSGINTQYITTHQSTSWAGSSTGRAPRFFSKPKNPVLMLVVALGAGMFTQGAKAQQPLKVDPNIEKICGPAERVIQQTDGDAFEKMKNNAQQAVNKQAQLEGQNYRSIALGLENKINSEGPSTSAKQQAENCLAYKAAVYQEGWNPLYHGGH